MSQEIKEGNGEWNRPGHVKRWNVATGARARTLEHTGEVLAAAVSPEGGRLAVAGGDGTIRLRRFEP